jgi:putative tryptophan/tyrosine transport system substrate-binding protein
VLRRDFITLLGGVAVGWPLYVHAREPDRPRRIGILFGGFSDVDPEPQARIGAFRAQLQELGWIEGRNAEIDVRFGGGDDNRRETYAEELIRKMPDVIVANSAPAVKALTKKTKTTPIVFTNVFDPVSSALVESLARPGGNVTGFSNFSPEMTGKWLELLKEIAPGVKRVCAMFDRANNPEFAQEVESLAPSFHLQYFPAPVSRDTDIQNAIDAIARESNSGLIVIGGTVTSAHREAIVRLVTQRRVPAVYAYRYYVTNGGLLSYGVDPIDMFVGAARYVDHILKGTKPADLPVQLPTKFELVINLKAAKALGLTVPPSLLVRADEVIE